jgi:hypothetical protein
VSDVEASKVIEPMLMHGRETGDAAQIIVPCAVRVGALVHTMWVPVFRIVTLSFILTFWISLDFLDNGSDMIMVQRSPTFFMAVKVNILIVHFLPPSSYDALNRTASQ